MRKVGKEKGNKKRKNQSITMLVEQLLYIQHVSGAREKVFVLKKFIV